MTGLSSQERERLGAIADLLIPRTDDMPSATDAAADGLYLDRVFEVRPDLQGAVRAALASAPDPLPESVDDIDAADFARLRPLADAVTAAYFINPDVARRVGYRTRSVIPIRFDEDLDTLTAKVVARGPVYRPTPARKEH